MFMLLLKDGNLGLTENRGNYHGVHILFCRL